MCSSLGLPRAHWHHHNGQPKQAAAGENTAYSEQGSGGVSAPVSQSGGVSGYDGKDQSCDASPETSSADDTVVPTEEKDSQQAASTGSDTSTDGGADTAAAPVEKASTSDSTSTDQSSSNIGSSNSGINNSTGAVRASVSSRKGAGLWYFKEIATMASDIHATWAYDWSDDPLENSFKGTAPAGVDLVAMFDSTSDYSSLASSSYKEVVGWNEPDATAAPVDSATAAQVWPNIVKTVGKRMGSPAPASTSLTQGDWFYDFMTSVIKAGSPPDFICLHYYSPNGDVSKFQSYIEGVYNMYKLPIWVTEWAYVDYSKDPATVPSTAEQVAYMQAAVKMMDELSYIERFAWVAVPWSSVQPASSLFDEFGSITPMGTAYAAL